MFSNQRIFFTRRGKSSASVSSLDGIMAYWNVNDSSTITSQLNTNFTSANVNTTSGNIALNLGFTYTAPNTESAGVARVGTPVYFSSTGTLPSIVGGGTLQPNTRYYAISNAAGTETELYPENNTTDTIPLKRYVPYENVLKCVNLYAGIQKIMLSSGGSGTHTISTNPLCGRVPNQISEFNTPLETTDTNPNARIEVLTDAQGKKYLNFAGNLAKITSATAVNGQGIGKKIEASFLESGGKVPFQQRWGNKRYAVMSNACYVDDEPIFDLRKAIVIPPTSGTYTQTQTGTYTQNTTTVTITLPQHGLLASTGHQITITSATGTPATPTGTFNITAVSTDTITYTTSNSQTASGSITFNGRAVVVTATNHGLISGQQINVTSTTGSPSTPTGLFTVGQVRGDNVYTYIAAAIQASSGNITFDNCTINASTGVFTTIGGHGFPVGTTTNGFTEVTITKASTSTLPNGLNVYNGLTTPSRNTVWLRGISSTTFSLHPTYADCKANTNAYTYTTGTGTGTGEFYIGMYAGFTSKPEEHYFSSLDFPLQWASGSLNGTGAQRFMNQTINTGMYASGLHGITNAEIVAMGSTYGLGGQSGLCASVSKAIAGMFVTGATGKDGALVVTTLPLASYPVKIYMSPNAVYPYCTTLGRRLTNSDTFWGVPYPSGGSTRGWLFQNKADADAFVATNPTVSSNPSNALVLDNAQYDFSNPSANNGFYGQFCWYMGNDSGLLGTSNVIPAHTIMPIIPIRKKVVLTTILDLNNQDTTALKTCGVQCSSADVATTYTVTVNGTPFSHTTVPTCNGTYVQNQSGTYSQSGTTVTVTKASHGFSVSQSVIVTASDGTALGTFTIATVPTTSTFTYTSSSSLTSSGNITFSGKLVTATITGHGLTTGRQVVVTASTGGTPTGTFTGTVVDANTITYTTSGSNAINSGNITLHDATTTNVLDALVTNISVSGTGEGRKTSTMMHIWSTSTTGTFSLSVSSNLTIRTMIRYKLFVNTTQITTGWEDYNNSDIRYTELLDPANIANAPCQVLYGSPAQPHVGYIGRLYGALLAATNTNPEAALVNDIIPTLMTEYAITA